MGKLRIYAAGGTLRAVLRKWEYNGTWMGERSISATIGSAEPIDWAIGDWCDYRGERFSIAVLPKLTRRARSLEYGEALSYELTLIPQGQYLLQDVLMRDLVPGDNNLHYTALTNFSFYADMLPSVESGVVQTYSAGVRAFADRVGAVLADRYGDGYFSVVILEDTVINGDQNVSISNQSVWAALGSVCQSFDIAFDVRVSVSGGVLRRVVEFSPKTIEARSAVSLGMEWSYGKGNGLVTLECNVDTNQQVVTRLYAVGSERNLPYRYYNYLWYRDVTTEGVTERVYLERRIDLGGKYLDKDGNELPITDADAFAVEWVDDTTMPWTHWYRAINSGMYVPRLMLPTFRASGQMYVDSANASSLGIKEGFKAFDTEDVHEKFSADIYPSIEGVTYGDVYNSMSQDERTYQRYNYGRSDYPVATTPLDAVRAYGIERGEPGSIADWDVVDWDGIIPEGEQTDKWFTVRIPNLGFNINDMLVDGDTPRISMKSGMCCGREFNILSCKAYDYNIFDVQVRDYDLNLGACEDESIGQYFPNRNFPIAVGDRFVILGIEMPDIYVRSAEQRLATAASAWLSDNDNVRYTYNPKMDNVFLGRNPAIASSISEGKVMCLVDDELGIDVQRIITQLKISEGSADLPQYELTVAEEQEPSLTQRVTEEVSSSLAYYGFGGGGVSDAKVRQILTMLNDLPNQYVSKTKSDTAKGIIAVTNGLVTDIVNSFDYDNKNGFNISPNIITLYAPSDTVTTDEDFEKVVDNISEPEQVINRTATATQTLVCTTTGYAAFAGVLELGASGASRFTILSREIVIEDTDTTDPEATQSVTLEASGETEEMGRRVEVTAGKTYNVSHVMVYNKYGSISAGFELGIAGMVFNPDTSRAEQSDEAVTVYSTKSESVNGIRLNAHTKTVQTLENGEWIDY